MHPTGIEPALKASEAFVLSVRLRVQVNITNLLHHLEYNNICFLDCLVINYKKNCETLVPKSGKQHDLISAFYVVVDSIS